MCGGYGRLQIRQRSMDSLYASAQVASWLGIPCSTVRICGACGGTGIEPCTDCDGTGQIDDTDLGNE